MKICFCFRFIYGQVEVSDFKSVHFGTQLYEFAHLMEIESLLTALDVFFTHPKASHVFAVFEVYHKFGNQTGLDMCKEVDIFLFHILQCKFYLLLIFHNINFEECVFRQNVNNK